MHAAPIKRGTSRPSERLFVVVNAAPVPALTLDRGTGTAPHTATFDIAATDADGDRLSYELDFGDGQSATGRAAGLARAPLRRPPAPTPRA